MKPFFIPAANCSFRLRRLGHLVLLGSLASCSIGCGGGGPAKSAETGASARVATQTVFDLAVPSVVAVLNDDAALRAEEDKRVAKELGIQAHAPKTVVDVSLRKERMPHGTGFVIEGGDIVTAAHVIHVPDRLKVTTRQGQTVDAALIHIDEVRDVAILRPRVKLEGVQPLPLYEGAVPVGRKVWALGHTGAGLWALSWGISEGIASGNVDLLGSNLLLFDASVYPGFSGGPVVTFGEDGKLRAVGVNHAILFAGGTHAATISSAASIMDLRAVIARQPAPIEKVLGDYAKKRNADVRGEIFITERLSVHIDSQMRSTAMIVGNRKSVEAADVTRVPLVAMLFGLSAATKEIDFMLLDPDEKPVATLSRPVTVKEKERVTFVGADLHFSPKMEGRYDIIARIEGKEIMRTDVWVENPDDDAQAMEEEDVDDSEDGQPRVDIVVAQGGSADPLALVGVRSAWAEYHYPRRVDFTWFARGSRGWSGSNVAISAFVLDDTGKIVGRGVGCIRPEIRPEHNWSCVGQGGTPLVQKTGRYDVVFALNDRPVAVWPMEAILRTDDPENGALSKWLKELRKHGGIRRAPALPLPPPAGKPAKPGKSDKPSKRTPH